ncbi:hypothetical protein DFH08DRAFT_1090372 [Mycena albidolilacea]|uniref:Uncharacterized protein n=1 Tax=Mycena albidolilacea TaxID=1033008 RepID=A0AAD6YXY1_9AGAR|nr:hypothetical protein DFH08DRAFT_1090372 [Mycena albidolilacea]
MATKFSSALVSHTPATTFGPSTFSPPPTLPFLTLPFLPEIPSLLANASRLMCAGSSTDPDTQTLAPIRGCTDDTPTVIIPLSCDRAMVFRSCLSIVIISMYAVEEYTVHGGDCGSQICARTLKRLRKHHSPGLCLLMSTLVSWLFLLPPTHCLLELGGTLHAGPSGLKVDKAVSHSPAWAGVPIRALLFYPRHGWTPRGDTHPAHTESS